MSSRPQDEAACKNWWLAGCTDADDGPELGRPSVDGTVVEMSRRLGLNCLEVG